MKVIWILEIHDSKNTPTIPTKRKNYLAPRTSADKKFVCSKSCRAFKLSVVHICLSHREQVKMPSLFVHVLSILGIIALTTGQEQLLMVFGGRFGEVPTLFPKYRDVHLLSLDGGPPLPWCLQSLNRHPRVLFGSCQATLGNGK